MRFVICEVWAKAVASTEVSVRFVTSVVPSNVVDLPDFISKFVAFMSPETVRGSADVFSIFE